MHAVPTEEEVVGTERTTLRHEVCRLIADALAGGVRPEVLGWALVASGAVVLRDEDPALAAEVLARVQAGLRPAAN